MSSVSVNDSRYLPTKPVQAPDKPTIATDKPVSPALSGYKPEPVVRLSNGSGGITAQKYSRTY